MYNLKFYSAKNSRNHIHAPAQLHSKFCTDAPMTLWGRKIIGSRRGEGKTFDVDRQFLLAVSGIKILSKIWTDSTFVRIYLDILLKTFSSTVFTFLKIFFENDNTTLSKSRSKICLVIVQLVVNHRSLQFIIFQTSIFHSFSFFKQFNEKSILQLLTACTPKRHLVSNLIYTSNQSMPFLKLCYHFLRHTECNIFS